MRMPTFATAPAFLAFLLFVPAMTAAQQSAGDTGRWEVQVFGGVTVANGSPRGVTALPPPGPTLTTSTPIFPSRQISSWLFGDGASLLNDVNADFGLAARVVPLDAAFASPGFGGTRPSLGITVRRALTRRYSVEAGFSVEPGAQSLPDVLASQSDTTRASFESAMRALLADGPFSDVAVRATSTSRGGSGRDVALTGALNVHFRPFGSFEPYVSAGAGVIASVGEAPSVAIEAAYEFRVFGSVPIAETDRVIVRATRHTVLAAIAGGGVRRQLSERWALRIDGRLLIGPGGQRLVLDAAPRITTGSPAGYVESFTHPSVQFSNDPSTGRQSTLSGAPIDAFEVFRSDGVLTRGAVTIGIARRF